MFCMHPMSRDYIWVQKMGIFFSILQCSLSQWQSSTREISLIWLQVRERWIEKILRRFLHGYCLNMVISYLRFASESGTFFSSKTLCNLNIVRAASLVKLRVLGPPRAFLTSKMASHLFPSPPAHIKIGEIILFEQWRAVIIVCSVYNVCTQVLQWVPYAHHWIFFLSSFFIFSFFQQKTLRNLLGETLFFT